MFSLNVIHEIGLTCLALFTDEFKNQMVQLYLNGKPRAEIIREYDLGASAFDKWVKQVSLLITPLTT
ncbi:transposase [Desulfosporosinus sp. FKA]|uniref:transposase n=1 Tax=Desulfosporosinus sp. FKA TaxID=1969834 RepID=UPI001FA85C84|nr:transposase [Desulfosporosinus sp. FKA]